MEILTNKPQEVGPSRVDVSPEEGPVDQGTLFTQEEYEKAWENAGPLARARFVAKTTKKKWRAPEFRPKGEKGEPEGVYKKHLPPKDVIFYIVAWVTHFVNKGAKNEKV